MDKENKPTPRVEKYINNKGKQVHREYIVPSHNDLDAKTKESLRIGAIVVTLLANIPANCDDNDPLLVERMQSIFDQYYTDYMARYAGIPIDERIMPSLEKTGEYSEEKTGDYFELKIPDSRDMKPDCIAEMRTKLTSFDINDIHSNVNRIRLRRMLAFLDNMPNTKSPKSFTQFLINIPDDRKQDFAVALRDEFASEKGKKIRYMIEALIKLGIMTNIENASELYDACKNHFVNHIGSRQSIFDPKRPDDDRPGMKSWNTPIKGAIDRINPIWERFA